MDLEATNGAGQGTPTPSDIVMAEDSKLAAVLRRSVLQHSHICPRQVLGARMGLLGLRALGCYGPPPEKRLHMFVETEGCFVDGLSAATGCRVGARTLHVIDHGKMAATLVDAHSERAYRIHPRSSARDAALEYAPECSDQWHAYLEGYQRMPDDLLFELELVRLIQPIGTIISTPKAKAVCSRCGEEIFNGREISREQQVLCRACAGQEYWRSLRD